MTTSPVKAIELIDCYKKNLVKVSDVFLCSTWDGASMKQMVLQRADATKCLVTRPMAFNFSKYNVTVKP